MSEAWIKYLSDEDAAQARRLKHLTFRASPLKRKLYRKAFHLKNRGKENASNLKRYHERHKLDPRFMEKRRAAWRSFAKKQPTEWSLLRSRKYRKHYSQLSERQRNAIREAYKRWAKENWGKRVQYARDWRHRQPLAGFRKAIAEASRTGDVEKLIACCELAIIRAHEVGHGKRSKREHR